MALFLSSSKCSFKIQMFHVTIASPYALVSLDVVFYSEWPGLPVERIQKVLWEMSNQLLLLHRTPFYCHVREYPQIQLWGHIFPCHHLGQWILPFFFFFFLDVGPAPTDTVLEFEANIFQLLSLFSPIWEELKGLLSSVIGRSFGYKTTDSKEALVVIKFILAVLKVYMSVSTIFQDFVLVAWYSCILWSTNGSV